MKLKALGVILLSLILISGTATKAAQQSKNTVPASFIYQAIEKYRNGNYTGCIQDMGFAIKNNKAVDIAYYYQAVSYSKIGMKEQAKDAYSRAKAITKDKAIITYSTIALDCLNDEKLCDAKLDPNDISSFILSDQPIHPDAKTNIQTNALDRVKEQINGEGPLNEVDLKYLNQNQTSPTDKEIADAVRTFSKLGINPFSTVTPQGLNSNNEMLQLSMLLGNQNNNSNSNNMFNLMNSFGGFGDSGNFNKDFLQAYMMNQMLPTMGFTSKSSDR